MPDSTEQIFRPSAIRFHHENRKNNTLPRFISPRVFWVGWLVLIAVLGAGAVTLFFQVPTYLSSQAFPLSRSGSRLTVVLVLPQAVQVGQRVQLIDSSGQVIFYTAVETQPEALTQTEFASRFQQIPPDLPPDQAFYIATLTADHSEANFSTSRSYQARVQVGTTYLSSLFGLSS